MCVEKTSFVNIFSLIMDIKRKIKDSLKLRIDLKKHYIRKKLELIEIDIGRCLKPKANYAYILEQRRGLCEWVHFLKILDIMH